MRGLLNTAYSALAQNRDEEQMRELDAKLDEEPRTPSASSKEQMAGLMGLMKTQGRG